MSLPTMTLGDGGEALWQRKGQDKGNWVGSTHCGDNTQSSLLLAMEILLSALGGPCQSLVKQPYHLIGPPLLVTKAKFSVRMGWQCLSILTETRQ